MSNLEKYNRIFAEQFFLEEAKVSKAALNKTDNWDSVGHMELITQIEDTFDIMFETEEILEFTSYIKGIKLLKKYGIEIV